MLARQCQAKHLEQHGEPGTECRETLGADGDGLIGAGAGNLEAALLGEQSAQGGEISAHTRRV